jgi:thiol-disulfide isomerase/thioredoxin
MLLTVAAAAQTSSASVSLRLRDINGRRVSLPDYKGKVVLINFWATWCPPCRTEIPDLVRLQNKYRKRGLRIIGITYPPQTLSQVRRFVRKTRINYSIALGRKSTKTLFDQSEILPVTVIINRQGKVHATVQGILFPEEFDEKIKPLLDDVGSNL